ncbi:MAG: hypothetical protein LBP80_10765 [Treponema sp.]|jgi:hypothetical protein|nr:hypothetical protein [Treponema sp.]
MTDMDKAIEEAWHQDALAAVMPFESWERLPGESSLAYAAFCAFRDYGPERNIRKAAEGQFNKAELSGARIETAIAKRYRVWRNWCSQFRWRERAADYDNYTDKLKQAEFRKTIEAQGEKHRAVTGKMLAVVEKKLDLMDPADLTQGTVTEWVETAIRAEREAAGLVTPNGGKTEPKQGEINFTPEFEGL